MSFIDENLYSGFVNRDQETKYNLTLFDLLLTLASRVNASLRLSKSTLPYSINYMRTLNLLICNRD
jgi:hypothetical protein